MLAPIHKQRMERLMSESDPGQEIKAPVAKTAGEQDHSDPWKYAGEDADAPADGVQDGTGPEGER